MKRLIPFFVLIVLVLVIGCAMQQHRAYIRDNIMAVGVNRHAFILEWGAPDIQFMQNEFQEAAPSIYEDMMGRFQQRRPAYGVEGWVYVEQNWLLIFYGKRLVAYYYWDKVKDQFKGLEFSFDADKRQTRPKKKPKPESIGEAAEQRRKIPDKRSVPPVMFKDKVVIGILDFEKAGQVYGLEQRKKALMKELRRNTLLKLVDIRESCGLSDLKRYGYERAERYKDIYQVDMILHVYFTRTLNASDERADLSLINLYTKRVKEVSIETKGISIEHGFRGISRKLLPTGDLNLVLREKKEVFGKKE